MRRVPLDAQLRALGPAHTVPLGEVPERLRLVARHAIREQLIQHALTPGEQEALSVGREALPELASRALLRAVRKLETAGFAEDAQADVSASLDLFEQLESNIPFDVQTTFWDGWSKLGAAHRTSLHLIARRLGFTGV